MTFNNTRKNGYKEMTKLKNDRFCSLNEIIKHRTMFFFFPPSTTRLAPGCWFISKNYHQRSLCSRLMLRLYVRRVSCRCTLRVVSFQITRHSRVKHLPVYSNSLRTIHRTHAASYKTPKSMTIVRDIQ